MKSSDCAGHITGQLAEFLYCFSRLKVCLLYKILLPKLVYMDDSNFKEPQIIA